MMGDFGKILGIGWAVVAESLRSTSTKPSVMLDIGSRGGLARRWVPAARLGLIVPVFVEPDPTESARLARQWPGVRIIQDALGERDLEQAILHVTREPGRSSLLQPDLEVIRRYEDPTAWEVISKVDVCIRRLDAIWGEDCGPDFVKLDVQGLELGVLQGMGRMLEGVKAIELEASMVRLYRGQPLLGELHAVLDDAGFELTRMAALGLYRGTAMIEFNTYWIRRGWRNHPDLKMWQRLNRIGGEKRVSMHGY